MVKSFYISLITHIIIIIFALVSFKTTTIRPQRTMAATATAAQSTPVIKASMVNNEDIKMALERQKQVEVAEKLAEKKRQDELLANEKKALQLKKELENIKKQKIIEQAAVKKAEQEKLKMQQEAKKVQQQILQEKKAKEKLQKELAAKSLAAEQAAAAAKIAAEKKAEAEFQEWVDGEVNKYAALLEQKVVQNRNNLFTFSPDLNCDIHIQLTEAGDLINAVIVKSSGNLEYDDFQLKAISKSAPFNMPEDKAILAKFQDIILNFTNDGDRISEIS